MLARWAGGQAGAGTLCALAAGCGASAHACVTSMPCFVIGPFSAPAPAKSLPPSPHPPSSTSQAPLPLPPPRPAPRPGPQLAPQEVLRQEKARDPRMAAYLLAADGQKPGYFYLGFILRETPHREHFLATPDGFHFRQKVQAGAAAGGGGRAGRRAGRRAYGY